MKIITNYLSYDLAFLEAHDASILRIDGSKDTMWRSPVSTVPACAYFFVVFPTYEMSSLFSVR